MAPAVLIRHPAAPASPATRIEVEATRIGPAGLRLAYRLTGAIADLVLPPSAASERTDELWRHTCFEAFVRPAPGERYVELNLAPSTQWAAYRFEAHRAWIALANIAAPVITVQTTADTLTLTAALDLAAAPGLAASPWTLALTAVIEARDGSKSYWSLAHSPERPDFHSPAGFVLELPA